MGLTHTCHLVDLSCMVNTRFSLTLADLHASALVDEGVAARVRIERHVLYAAASPESVVDDVVSQLDLEGPVLVGFTIYFWNRDASLLAARRIKDRNRHAMIVFGGNDVSNQGDDLLAKHAEVDVVVNGEGEITFRHLLSAWSHDQPLRGVAGLTLRDDDGAIVTTPARPRVENLGDLPSPLLTGLVSADEIARSRTVVYELGRGCPFSCSFCYWGGAINTRVRWYPIERVREELEFLVANLSAGSTLFLADANFGMANADIEVARLLVELTRRFDKEIFLFANWAKSRSERVVETARTLFEGNLIASVTLSAQSLSEETLELVNRRNIPWSHYEKLQHRFAELGIPTYTELILGLPGETRESYLDGVARVLDVGGHPVVYPLLLLNNTELASPESREKHGFVVRSLPYQLADTSQGVDTVVATATLATDEWVELLQLNLALAACHHVLARSVVRWCAGVRGWRAVLELLGEVFDDATAIPEMSAVYANHGATLLDPDRYDAGLVTRWSGVDCIGDHVHFQALCQIGVRQPDRLIGRLRTVLEPACGPLPEPLIAQTHTSLAALASLATVQPHFDATLLALYHGSLAVDHLLGMAASA